MHARKVDHDRGNGRSTETPAAGDYDADYRALDLPPGAPLREITDRARLLRAAFDPDLVPVRLRAEALARSSIVERAADTLSHYWRTHGAAPPTAAGRRPDGAPGEPAAVLGSAQALFDALVLALNEPVTKPGADPSATAAPAQPRIPAPSRAVPAAPQPSPAVHPVAAEPAPAPPRAAATPRSALLKAAAIALAAALTLWLHYRTDRAEADAIAAPATQPARPALLTTTRPPTGAAAPSPVRSPYSNDNSRYFGR